MAGNNNDEKKREEALRKRLKEEADKVREQRSLADLRARIVRDQIKRQRRLRDRLRRKKKDK